MSKHSCSRRSGLTLVELAIVMALLGSVLTAMHGLLQAMADGYRSGTARMDVDNDGNQAIRKLTSALRHADVETLVGLPERPFWTTTFDLRRSVGFDGTNTQWTPTERLAYSVANGTFTWTRAPGTAQARVLVRLEGVAPLAQGEAANGLDDNGNGLVDEPGFHATRDGDLLTLQLTLLGRDPDGRPIERIWTTSLQCRN